MDNINEFEWARRKLAELVQRLLALLASGVRL